MVLGPLRPCLTLLPAGVTRPPVLLRTPVVSYTTFSLSPRPPPLPMGEGWGEGLPVFCGPVRQVGPPRMRDRPAPGIIRRRALWSADFPRPRIARPRPPDQPEVRSSYHSLINLFGQAHRVGFDGFHFFQQAIVLHIRCGKFHIHVDDCFSIPATAYGSSTSTITSALVPALSLRERSVTNPPSNLLDF